MATATSTPTTASATVLLSRGLTPGKMRGLQRISNPNGTLTMLALDQNSSMINMAKKALADKGLDRDPTYEEIVEAKVDLMRQMGTAASGALIDAYYGAWSVIASGALPRETGMLVRIEKSGGPKNAVGAPITVIEDGLSVATLKSIGTDAVKLLAPFEPTEPHSAECQLQFIQYIYEECIKNDILCLLEPVSFPFGGSETKKDASYLNRKAATVIESARQISRFCDVYKAEFPGTLGHESDEQLRDNLQALDAACERPWVLLSAGVDYPDYYKQVQMAMDCGASGVLGGRAFWKEYFLQDGPEARTQFAATTGRDRVAEVDKLVRENGTPWFAKYGFSMEELGQVRAVEGWHTRYNAPPAGAPTTSGHVVRPGETY